MELSVLTDAMGSSLVELGHTKVICKVGIGPPGSMGGSSSSNKSVESVDTGTLDCRVQLAPHVGVNPITQRMQMTTPASEQQGGGGNANMFHPGKLRSQILQRESYMSSQLRTALRSSVRLDLFPKCCVFVRVTILQDDGGALSACVAAATLALVDAKVPMYDLVTSCTVAVRWDASDEGEVTPTYLADPNEDEMLSSDAFICLALTANHREVTLWTQSGKALSASVVNEAIELGRKGCRTMHKFIREKFVYSNR